MKHVFKRIETATVPRPGDMIRSGDTPDYINIVLSVSVIRGKLAIRSVRYAHIKNGSVKRLFGTRSRSFYWQPHKWDIVMLYAIQPVNNYSERMAILESLKNVDTSYHPPKYKEEATDDCTN
mgnify:CR=1 FL=1